VLDQNVRCEERLSTREQRAPAAMFSPQQCRRLGKGHRRYGANPRAVPELIDGRAQRAPSTPCGGRGACTRSPEIAGIAHREENMYEMPWRPCTSFRSVFVPVARSVPPVVEGSPGGGVTRPLWEPYAREGMRALHPWASRHIAWASLGRAHDLTPDPGTGARTHGLEVPRLSRWQAILRVRVARDLAFAQPAPVRSV